MNQCLGGLGEIPLQMAAQARAVIEGAEQMGRQPLAVGCEHTARAGVKIKVPQTVHVGGFVASHLALLEAACGALGAGSVST